MIRDGGRGPVADLPVAPLAEGLRYERPFADARRARRRSAQLDVAHARRRRADLGARRCVSSLAVAEHRVQGVDLPPVRSHRPRRHRACGPARDAARGARPRRRRDPAARQGRWRSPPTATRASAALDPYEGARLAVAEAYRNLSHRRRRAARGHRLPQLRQPRAARDHVAVRRGDPRPRRRLPRARDAGRLRQRLALQRDRRARRSSPRRPSAWSGSSPTPPTPSGRRSQDGHAIALLGVNTDEMGGSEYLARIHGSSRRRAAAARPRARASPSARACRALVAAHLLALGARLLRRRPRGRARRMLHPAGRPAAPAGRRNRQAFRGATSPICCSSAKRRRASWSSFAPRARSARCAPSPPATGRPSPSSGPLAGGDCRSTSRRRAS